MKKTALLASVLAAAVVGCGGDFNKPALLDTPRFLAVKADPPQPKFGAATTLSALVYQPPIESCAAPGTTTYHWSWCPWPMSSNSGYECPITQPMFDQIYAGLGLGAAPSLDLGTSETATFTNPFPAEVLYALCRGDIGSNLGGESTDAGAGRSVFSCTLRAEDYNTPDTRQQHPIAFKVTVKVVVTPACPSLLPEGFNPLVAVYSLYLPTDDSIPVNQNPVLSGIWATQNHSGLDGGTANDDGGAVDAGEAVDGGSPRGPSTFPPDGGIPLDDQASVTVARNKHVGLLLDISMDSSEHLAVPSTVEYDSTKDLTRHYERLTFAWYTEAGEFTGRGKGRNTGYLPPAYPPGEDKEPTEADRDSFKFNIENTWDLPRRYEYDEDYARIIVVVRDGRGGVDWTSKLVRLEPQP